MNALKVLRSMHADTKVRFKVILGSDDPQVANQAWLALQPMLKLHEALEDEFVYGPLQAEFGPGTPLGDWDVQHDADVAVVEQLVQQSGQLTPGTPEWKMCVGTIMDVLSKHVMDEEGQIFGRVEQVWDAARLDQAGVEMEKLIEQPVAAKAAPKPKAARRRR
jgi:hypothetical protein